MDFVKEHIDQVVLDLQLRKLGGVVNSVLGTSCNVWFLHEGLDALIQDVCDRLHLRLLVCSHGRESVMTLLIVTNFPS